MVENFQKSVMLFLVDNNIKPTRKNIKMLLKNMHPIAEYIGSQHFGFIQLALMSIMPARSKKTILKEIVKVENKMLEYSKRPRISTGAYNKDMQNYSHKLKSLRQELNN